MTAHCWHCRRGDRTCTCVCHGPTALEGVCTWEDDEATRLVAHVDRGHEASPSCPDCNTVADHVVDHRVFDESCALCRAEMRAAGYLEPAR